MTNTKESVKLITVKHPCLAWLWANWWCLKHKMKLLVVNYKMAKRKKPIHIVSFDAAFGEDVSCRTTIEPLMDGSFKIIKIEYQDKKSGEWHE